MSFDISCDGSLSQHIIRNLEYGDHVSSRLSSMFDFTQVPKGVGHTYIYNEVCVSQYLKIGHSSVQRWKIASVSVCVSIHSHGPGLAPGSGCGLG